MPTYEYRCPDGHDFEKFVQKISLASSELPCPVCGKMADRRISAGGGLVFKGSGFYITDYGKDGKKDLRANAAAASSGDKHSPSAKGEGSSSGDSASKGEGGSSSGSSAKGETSKSDASKSESSKGDASKSDRPKSDKPKSDKPAAAPSAPKSPGTDK
jgi:putative FmdB family regulatory protein